MSSLETNIHIVQPQALLLVAVSTDLSFELLVDGRNRTDNSCAKEGGLLPKNGDILLGKAQYLHHNDKKSVNLFSNVHIWAFQYTERSLGRVLHRGKIHHGSNNFVLLCGNSCDNTALLCKSAFPSIALLRRSGVQRGVPLDKDEFRTSVLSYKVAAPYLVWRHRR